MALSTLELIILAVAFLLGWNFLQRRQKSVRLAKLGSKPVEVQSWVPFGLDIFWDAISV
jgi:hypothetical protein